MFRGLFCGAKLGAEDIFNHPAFILFAALCVMNSSEALAGVGFKYFFFALAFELFFAFEFHRFGFWFRC